ncbi:PadR family transcriptional regulator [Gemella sp. zg-1178]|uniref:PadR family transcriptional regulator n=1 Tax=Gemella sp. zg-1178 TaxID=2840372 RepID=UPI001C04B728|nr:PadR family transcriptional regulator [Gemella sp. zg-1178]MBU0279195.1 PadR family transcriptional regulator [Gemella sp. zg-1178]
MEINTSQILKGILEVFVLKIISKRDMYGYEINEKLSEYKLNMVAQGTIYPLLLKLEKEKLLTSYSTTLSSGPPRKYYKITKKGIKYINDFIPIWKNIYTAINNILNIKGENNED